MILVSVAQAARCLGIDAKTLHRWLAQAGLPVQRHPTDSRQKGVSLDHVQTLARVHQRTLLPLSTEPPMLAVSPPPESAALLTLTEQLAALHTRIAAVQQQVADLTCLLQAHESASASPAAQPQPGRTARRPKKPTPPARTSRPEAKTPRKPTHVIPRVEYGQEGYYVVICPRKGLLSLEPDTPEWFAWVREQEAFHFVGKEGHFTAHHWWRVPRGAWRAHRQIRNHSYTLRLAPNHELTLAVLEQAAATLQAHLQ